MKDKILKFILDKYLNDGDYSGSAISTLYEKFDDVVNLKLNLIELITEEKIEVYYCKTNHFVKNFKLNIPLQTQIKLIEELTEEQSFDIFDEIIMENGNYIQIGSSDLPPISLFPTSIQIKEVIKDKVKYHELPPFEKMMLDGMPRLNFLYFRIDVLNRFLYDPRYIVSHLDYTGSIYYLPEEDSVDLDENNLYLKHFGIAYNKKTNENVITVFPCDLAKLSPKHQYHFYSHMYEDQTPYAPDVAYWKNVMGEVSEGISIFSAFNEELQIINKMTNILCGKALFKKEFNLEKNRPEYFHPFLIPTKTMYCNFCRTLYRMFADQLDVETIKKIALKLNIYIQDFEDMRALKALKNLFSIGFKSFNGTDTGKEILSIWQGKIHDNRNRLSHSFVDDIYDPKFVFEYRKILDAAYRSVRLIRLVLSSLPEIKQAIVNKEIEISDDLYNGNINMYFAPFKTN